MRNDKDGPVWVLADDRTGNVAQCVGVAEALGWPFELKDIRYDRLGSLPNLLRGATLLGVGGESRASLAPPWPRVVIAAGRRTAPVARWIKRKCGAFLAQIMDPGPGGRDEFDLIVIPNHDGELAPSPNLLRVTGAPHRVTAARLAAAVDEWRPKFEHLPRPWVGLSVGGTTRKRVFTPEMAADLGRRVARLAAENGGAVLVTTSRRTGAAAEAALLDAIPEPRFVHRWGGPGANPYFGFLACADILVVTGDSTSMACEACAAPAPVFIYAPDGFVVPKHARLHEELYGMGLARPLPDDGQLGDRWDHPPINAAGTIAEAIRERLA
ncbi:MAG: mitochondrial fission ELM1 family protein [Solirubrobacterales bacterium]